MQNQPILPFHTMLKQHEKKSFFFINKMNRHALFKSFFLGMIFICLFFTILDNKEEKHE